MTTQDLPTPMDDWFKQAEQGPEGRRATWDTLLAALRWNADGLLPCITQDHASGQVLMMAWMNREALELTWQRGEVCYWSRSRQALWHKGATSGHVQRLVELRVDCDGDCLLCRVESPGPACHTGRRSCFFWQAQADGWRLVSSQAT